MVVRAKPDVYISGERSISWGGGGEGGGGAGGGSEERGVLCVGQHQKLLLLLLDRLIWWHKHKLGQTENETSHINNFIS